MQTACYSYCNGWTHSPALRGRKLVARGALELHYLAGSHVHVQGAAFKPALGVSPAQALTLGLFCLATADFTSQLFPLSTHHHIWQLRICGTQVGPGLCFQVLQGMLNSKGDGAVESTLYRGHQGRAARRGRGADVDAPSAVDVSAASSPPMGGRGSSLRSFPCLAS
jgi:hypothetical protein